MDFVQLLERKLGINAIKEYLPIQKGDVIETFADTSKLQKWINFSPETNIIFDKIIKILLQNKGYFLLIDYGYYSSPKISTLQSIKDNKKTNILDNPGDQDITYHVDFDNFKNILLKNNILNHRIISQAKFLFENGIKERTQVLIDSNPSKKEELNQQLELLTNDKFMGKLFKVLEIDI